MLKGTSYHDVDPNIFYSWENNYTFKLAGQIEKAQNIELAIRKRHPYFKKFEQIKQLTLMEWEHIDLFFSRETSQKTFKETILDNYRLADFKQLQLILSKKLIECCIPKVIVVVNALASEIFKRLFNVTPNQWDEERGYHLFHLKEKIVPVFFSSMLTGQRALDSGSFQRLCWHIRKAV